MLGEVTEEEGSVGLLDEEGFVTEERLSEEVVVPPPSPGPSQTERKIISPIKSADRTAISIISRILELSLR